MWHAGSAFHFSDYWKHRLSQKWLAFRLRRLRVMNRWAGSMVTGRCPVVVTLTSYGQRLASVHMTIESIAAGAVRPHRMILWVDDCAVIDRLPEPLKRLQRRGLEVRHCENFGPHTKYFPHVCQDDGSRVPFVTADDDVIYPRWWLKRLYEAHLRDRSAIHCYRARRIRVIGNQLAPYLEWPFASSTDAAKENFITGVSGVVYPAGFAASLRAAGRSFLDQCPRADDVWLSCQALRAGRRIRQVDEKAHEFPSLPGTQEGALFLQNQLRGENDRQIARTYSSADIAALLPAQTD